MSDIIFALASAKGRAGVSIIRISGANSICSLDKLVKKKESATTVVIFVRNVALPPAPNTVDDAPLPNAAPASAPLPC